MPAPEDGLVGAARDALALAYAPYSGFRVGAAIQGGGRVWTGSNIEIAASGVSLCAERVALAKAVSDGQRSFSTLVIVAEDPEPVTPCGVCRQTLQEFGDGLRVIMVGCNGNRIETTVHELMPFPFSRRPRTTP